MKSGLIKLYINGERVMLCRYADKESRQIIMDGFMFNYPYKEGEIRSIVIQPKTLNPLYI